MPLRPPHPLPPARQVRPAFMDEYEKLEKDLVKHYEGYLERFRNLDFLESELDSYHKGEVSSPPPVVEHSTPKHPTPTKHTLPSPAHLTTCLLLLFLNHPLFLHHPLSPPPLSLFPRPRVGRRSGWRRRSVR